MSDYEFEIPFEGDHHDVADLPPAVEIDETAIVYQPPEDMSWLKEITS